MPIKDPIKRKEYQKSWMSEYRQRQKNNVEPVKPINNFVKPCPNCLELQKQLEAVATLPSAYIDNLLAERDDKHKKHLESIDKQIKEAEQLKIKNKELKKPLAEKKKYE